MMTIFLERLFLSSCRKISFFSNNRGETLRLIPYSYFTRLVLGSKEEFIVVFQYCVAICQQIWKTQQWPQDWKRSLFIPIPKKGNAKECSNYHRIALILHASKVKLKILQARLQQYVNQEHQLVLEKAEETEIKLSTSVGSQQKQENSRKASTSAVLTTPEPLTLWITTNYGKF